MRPVFFLLGLFTVVNLCLSCTSISLGQESVSDYQAISALLHEALERDVFVDNVLQRDDENTEVSFSNNHRLELRSKDLQVITIGLDGRWYINGNQSSYLTERDSANEIVGHINGSIGSLCALTEWYEHWTFHFIGQPSITIQKTIYSKDYDDVVLSINHRGYSTLAPENTLAAFRLSRLKGFRYAETDVQFTKDNIPVLLHDDTIDRTSNGQGRINELSFAQVRQYDFGNWKSIDYQGTLIPSLDEFLIFCKESGLHPVLELKVGTKEQVSLVVDRVNELGLADDTIYISFSPILVTRVIEKKPSANVALLSSKVDDNTIKIVNSMKSEKAIAINANDYREETIAKCRESNIPLWVWVINKEETVLSLSSYITAVTSDSLHAGRLISKRKSY